VTVISATLVSPPAGTGKYEQAGIWFGNDEDNYVKLVVNSTPSGLKIEQLMEVDGTHLASKTIGVSNLAGRNITLRLVANPNDRTVTGSYALDGGAHVEVAVFTAPG